jgi:2-polyprenyl-3-methyl-5-hydroxy-6-metoxy-1,4-benzoquinol methylase
MPQYFYEKYMQNLPSAKIYKDEVKYMPWGMLIREILDIISKIPKGSEVLDLMCGPGYLLNELKQKKPDLKLTGVDLEEEYIRYGKKHYPGITFIEHDALDWKTTKKYDVVLVTAGVHHVSYTEQPLFIKKVASLLKKNGVAIIADPYIDDYDTEEERKVAAAKLGHEYLVTTIENTGPDEQIKAAIDLISNDIFLVEYKTSIAKMKPLLEKYFKTVTMHKTWPKEITQYGDYYFLLRK